MTTHTNIAIVGTEKSGKTSLTRALLKMPAEDYAPTTCASRHTLNENITLVDVPGNPKYNKTLCSSLTEADACILCISVIEDDRLLELLVILQCFKIPCMACVTSIDIEEERLHKLFKLAGFPFAPRVVILSGAEEVETLLRFPIVRGVDSGGLIAPILSVTQCAEGLLVSSVIHRGKVDAHVSELFLHPGGVAVKVLEVMRVSGRHVELLFRGEDRRLISKGMILSDDPNIGKKQLKAEIAVIGRPPNGVKSGFVGVVNWLNMQTPMKIEIDTKIDKDTGDDVKTEVEPLVLNAGDHARVTLTSQGPPVAIFGRFLIRNDNVVIAVGYASET